ncbi:bifunctional metallophosphatase/5'-nucleotidase [Nicoliella spurrieriana]|uniref:Bifunctional metallophosphatase/5'-nucleotidase n=1 Tax=Nicoliella spurrieriana TaxID=2925830 RepID=A0A976RS15_9LACO|nr:bifunctional UDP-sugar hydrolase/5'-nucleotidase [Nicoliella spurrieriana]UQS86764.1 bifunctional metallophosphatase/5'-nucleotidase [Nicoliella spurrieriana]
MVIVTEKLAILHTNDMHSHFENWPKIRRYINNQRAKLEADGYQVFVFDIGDAVDRAHPLTEATNGQANVRLMNEVKYDAVTIGNNEGLTNTHSQMEHLYDDANFDVVLGNLKELTTGEQPKWAQPTKQITTKMGTRIMMMGFTAPYILTYPLVGWNPINDQLAIPKLLKQHRGEYDVLFMLSHLGIGSDRANAAKYPEFDVIFGSHTHHLLENGELDNNVLLTGCQKWGHYVGTTKLTLNDNHQVINKSESVVKTADLPALAGDQAEIDGYESEGEALLASRKVAKIDHRMTKDWINGGELTQIGLSAMKQKAGTKAAVINAGLFLTDLPAGPIDKNQIHKLLPHSMHVMKTTLNGYNLWRLVREIEKNKRFLSRFPQKGMGFRGEIFGKIETAGIEYDAKTDVVKFDGQVVKNEEWYEIALLDHYLFIPFFPTVAIAGKNHMYYDQPLRDVFSDYLAKQFPLINK